MTDDEQSLEELQSHYGPDSPVEAAKRWLRLTLDDGNLRSAWLLTDPNLRLVLAQAWIWANRTRPLIAGSDLDEIAADLARKDPDKSLYWRLFARTQVDEIRHLNIDLKTWGVASRPRPIAPDYELVMLVETDGEAVLVTEPTEVLAQRLLMHLSDGKWLLAGFSETIPEPGWPPT